MANPIHINKIRKGTDTWNNWRQTQPGLRPDFTGAMLAGLNLSFGADLSDADFCSADLTSAILEGANFSHANLQGANLQGANLRKAILDDANLEEANLSGAYLYRARAERTSFRHCDFSGACLDFGTCDDADFHGALIKSPTYDLDEFSVRYSGGSVLSIVWGKGLGHLHPDSSDFLRQFTSDVFQYVHDLNTPLIISITEVDSLEEDHVPKPLGEPTIHRIPPRKDNSGVIDEMLLRLRLFQRVYSQNDDPALISAVSIVNYNLVEYLKKHPTDLRFLNWRTFEELIAELLSSFGWYVELTQPTKDNGYDILGIHKDISGISHSWIIECKCWAEKRKVGIEIARSLYTIKNELKVGGALLATTSDFTNGVKAFKASRYDFELKNYDGIVEWLKQYRK